MPGVREKGKNWAKARKKGGKSKRNNQLHKRDPANGGRAFDAFDKNQMGFQRVKTTASTFTTHGSNGVAKKSRKEQKPEKEEKTKK